MRKPSFKEEDNKKHKVSRPKLKRNHTTFQDNSLLPEEQTSESLLHQIMLQLDQMNVSMSAFENNVSEKIDSLDKNYQNLNVKLDKIEKEKE